MRGWNHDSWSSFMVHNFLSDLWQKRKFYFITIIVYHASECLYMNITSEQWIAIRLAIMESKDILTNDIWIMRSKSTWCSHDSQENKRRTKNHEWHLQVWQVNSNYQSCISFQLGEDFHGILLRQNLEITLHIVGQ